jgi:hypothetical protein
MRKIECERIADLRARLWAEMNGRPDSNDPSIIRKPSPKVMGDLIDSAIRLSQHEAMILGMDVQPRDALAAAVHSGLTIDDISELVEAKTRNTATLTEAVDVTPLQIEAVPAELAEEPVVVNGTANGLTFDDLLSARDGKGERERLKTPAELTRQQRRTRKTPRLRKERMTRRAPPRMPETAARTTKVTRATKAVPLT